MDWITIGTLVGVTVAINSGVTFGYPKLAALFKTDEGKVETKLVAEVTKAAAALAAHRAKYGSIFTLKSSASTVGTSQSVSGVSASPLVVPNPVSTMVSAVEKLL